MATATKKSRPTKRQADLVANAARAARLEFSVFEDNGGSYRWTIIADGATLARSSSFASRVEAEAAAQRVRNNVASAHPEFGAERGLDGGAGCSGEAVAG